jgi:hypothetical protein
VTLFNRGKTPLQKLPLESESEFQKRLKDTRFIQGNRQSAEVSIQHHSSLISFHYIYS